MQTDLVVLLVSVVLLSTVLTLSICVHLVKQFYKTSQDALMASASYRKRNAMLEYEYQQALIATTNLNNQLLQIKKDLEIKRTKEKDQFKAGFTAGADEVRKQFKIVRN